MVSGYIYVVDVVTLIHLIDLHVLSYLTFSQVDSSLSVYKTAVTCFGKIMHQ